MIENLFPDYDVIVVGAGHAGCEAAAAAANLGSKTLFITIDMQKIAQMSCNPAIGGIAKGQLVREIDALGGMSAIITDRSSIQFRMLNLSKGPAMWSPRSQCDRMKFSAEWRSALESIPNLDMLQDNVVRLKVDKDRVVGVVTALGIEFNAKSVVLTNGTFLSGLMHVGKVSFKGGRISEPESHGLTEQLVELGFETGRMKTGTPLRIDGRSVDFSKLVIQYGDETFHKFSYLSDSSVGLKQRPCYIAYTNKEVHDILRTGFTDSPLFNGTIKSIGPRYCPSIETKLDTFSGKDSHHLFLEPEGESTNEYYLNGFSSSLPWDVQLAALRKVEGFENVRIYRPGYAIEYDYFPPTQLYHTLQTKLYSNLFFAGQINGTTGYEEAAAQGLLAGINAHLYTSSKELLTISRSKAYIGVLIDDLVTKGVDEPYRMFTSRAEYRILLRQDNADERLTELGRTIGLVTDERYSTYNKKYSDRDLLVDYIRNYSVKQSQINDFLVEQNLNPLKQGCKLVDVLARPTITINKLCFVLSDLNDFITHNNLSDDVVESAEILLKYSGYIEREKLLVDKFSRLENLKIEGKFDYKNIQNLSTEARQKLEKIQPKTLGQASRISGVSPADISVLLVLMGR